MAETTGPVTPETPPVAPDPAPAAPAAEAPTLERPTEVSVRGLLEVGAHFGHQTRRWDPRMKTFIFGERNGIHILNLDTTAARLQEGLDFLREIVASGGKVLFVGTKRQAQESVKNEALRGEQFYVNNRWLGGMLTNFRTVKKSIERFKELIATVEDEEKVAGLSKKELSRMNRLITKYRKSLDGLKEMTRLPDAMFVMDINREHIALSEARRLGIPIVAIVDSNCNPDGIDYVVPGNDDAIRALHYYCSLAADACIEGATLHNERIQNEVQEQATGRRAEQGPAGRRVVEIKQPPRGRTRGPGGTHTADPRSPRRRREGAPAEAAPAEPAAAAEPAAEPPTAEAPAAAAPAAEAPATEAGETPTEN